MKILYYMNTFFAGLGGEQAADNPLVFFKEAKGPAGGLLANLGAEFEIPETAVAGDNYAATHLEDMLDAICKKLNEGKFDCVVAGPAFNAGRYAQACHEVCKLAADKGILAIMGMDVDAPGREEYSKDCFVFPSGSSAAGMRKTLPVIAAFIKRRAAGEELKPAAEEGHFPRGIRKIVIRDRCAAARALDMLELKLAGKPFVTENHVHVLERITPAPPVDLKNAVIGLANTGGLFPKGNPDHCRSRGGDTWGKYDFKGQDALVPGEWEAIHSGYSAEYADRNPNYIEPVSIMRELEKEGKFKRLHETFLATAGNGGAVGDCTETGQAFATYFKNQGVNAVILVST